MKVSHFISRLIQITFLMTVFDSDEYPSPILRRAIAPLPEGRQHRKDCVACIRAGHKWCGKATNPFVKTTCADVISNNKCKTKITEAWQDCLDVKVNPTYRGRKTIKDRYGNPPNFWSKACNETIDLKWTDVKKVVKTHSVDKDRQCLVTVNNLSGK